MLKWQITGTIINDIFKKNLRSSACLLGLLTAIVVFSVVLAREFQKQSNTQFPDELEWNFKQPQKPQKVSSSSKQLSLSFTAGPGFEPTKSGSGNVWCFKKLPSDGFSSFLLASMLSRISNFNLHQKNKNQKQLSQQKLSTTKSTLLHGTRVVVVVVLKRDFLRGAAFD